MRPIDPGGPTIRLHIGLESADLIADLEQALQHLRFVRDIAVRRQPLQCIGRPQ